MSSAGGYRWEPAWTWLPTRERAEILGRSDRYSIDVRAADGHVVRIQRGYTPVAVLREERAELEALNDWYRSRYPGDEPTRSRPFRP